MASCLASGACTMACGLSHLAVPPRAVTNFGCPMCPPAALKGRSVWTGGARMKRAVITPVARLISSGDANGRIHVDQKRSRSSRRSYWPRDESPITLLDGWDAGTLTRMIDTIGRLFDVTLNTAAPNTIRRAAPTQWDVVEDEDTFHLRVNIPGFGKEDVKVSVEDQTLVIKAEKPIEEGKNDIWTSTTPTKFSTRATLPDHVVLEEITADMKNGVLIVTVPKIKKEKKKKVIDVEVL